MQRSSTIDWFAEGDQSFLQHFSKSVRVVIQNDLMNDWIVVVLDVANFFPVSSATPVHPVSIGVVRRRWRWGLTVWRQLSLLAMTFGLLLLHHLAWFALFRAGIILFLFTKVFFFVKLAAEEIVFFRTMSVF